MPRRPRPRRCDHLLLTSTRAQYTRKAANRHFVGIATATSVNRTKSQDCDNHTPCRMRRAPQNPEAMLPREQSPRGTFMAPLLQRADRCILSIGTRKERLPRFHEDRQDGLATGFHIVERPARAAPAHLAVRRHLPDLRRWPCSLRSFRHFHCIDLRHTALLTWSQGRRLAFTSRVATGERQASRATQASHLPLAAQVCPGRCR